LIAFLILVDRSVVVAMPSQPFGLAIQLIGICDGIFSNGHEIPILCYLLLSPLLSGLLGFLRIPLLLFGRSLFVR
jgi:hypothetical protein